MNRRLALALSLFVSVSMAACSSDDTSAPSSSSQDSGATARDSGGGSQDAGGSKLVGGVAIPSSVKLCAQSLTAVSSSTKAGFSWKSVPNATRYAVLANKAPKGATELTEVFNGIVDGTANGASYEFPERVSGTTYTVEVFALTGSDVLCQLDGVNGITAS